MANNTVLVTDNAAFIRLILDGACPLTKVDGLCTFYIETHCVGWWVEAHKFEGEWVVTSMRSEPV